MAKAKKWTAAKIIALCKQHSVSLKSVSAAIAKAVPALTQPKPASHPKPSSSPLALAAACKKAYAAFEKAKGRKPNAKEKAKIKAALAEKLPKVKPSGKKPASGKKPSSGKKVQGRHVLTPKQMAEGRRKLKIYQDFCKAYKKKNGGSGEGVREAWAKHKAKK